MVALQEVVVDAGIWPGNIKDWVTLIVSVVTLSAIVAGATGRWLSGRLGVLREGLTRQIKDIEQDLLREAEENSKHIRSCERSADKLDGRLDQAERAMDKAIYERKGVDERLGRLEGMVETMANTINRHREQSEREVRAIRESVAQIQATVSAFGEMKNDLMTLAGRVLDKQGGN